MINALVVCGPSGSGKTTLCKHLLRHMPQTQFSVSACSRPPRPGEQQGIDYHFMSVADFQHHISRQAFLEYEEVYPNRFYGTLKSEFHQAIAKGHTLLFDVDVRGGINLKRQLGDTCLSILITPPSMQILEERLKARGTESAESIQQRLEKASYELSFGSQFDYVLVNDDLTAARRALLRYIKDKL